MVWWGWILVILFIIIVLALIYWQRIAVFMILMKSLHYIGEFLKFLGHNPIKSLFTLLFFIYAIISIVFYYTGAPNLGGFTKYMTMIWIGLGVFVSLWFYTATISGAGFNGASWRQKLHLIVTNFRPLKIFVALGLLVALAVGLIWALAHFTSLTRVVALAVQIICGIGILFAVYRYLQKNPRILSWILGNPLVQIIYNTIFLIPCSLMYLFNGTYSQAVKAPMIAYLVLLVECILVAAYIVAPMIRKWGYTYDPLQKTENIELNTKLAGTTEAILTAQKKYNADRNKVDVDWNKIYERGLYKTSNEVALKGYLIKQGYKKAGTQSGVMSYILGKSMTLEAAKSYVQSSMDTILKDQRNLAKLVDKKKALNAQKSGEGPFTSKILQNTVVNLNNKTNIGLFENLKGGADDYNYNYGLNAWIFLMAQGPEYGLGYSKDTSIINYGDKPNILFNPAENKLSIMVETDKKKNQLVYESTKLPLQRWNNIVVNYNGGTLDIFINKKLVSSTNGVIPYMDTDSITIGAQPGISGHVGNVTYFAAPVSQERIKFFYKMLKNKNPPIL